MIARFYSILLIPLLFVQCSREEPVRQLVVDARIRPGEPVGHISVRLMDERGIEKAKPVSNANVRLLSLGVTYSLNEMTDEPGHYAYDGSDLEIVSGQEYMLWVQHHEAAAVTSTIIRADTIKAKDAIENFIAKQ